MVGFTKYIGHIGIYRASRLRGLSEKYTLPLIDRERATAQPLPWRRTCGFFAATSVKAGCGKKRRTPRAAEGEREREEEGAAMTVLERIGRKEGGQREREGNKEERGSNKNALSQSRLFRSGISRAQVFGQARSEPLPR